jgi:hypothetical protein
MGFAWAAGVSLPVWTLIVLALVAWTVYVGDRLLDARAGLREHTVHHLQERHYFHWRHRRILIPMAGVAGFVAAWMVLQLLPHSAVKRDSIVAVATLAYFSGVHSRLRLPRLLSQLLSREFLVGVLFTAGCALPVLTRLNLRPALDSSLPLLLLPMAFYAVLAWLNCRAIGRWESASNESPQTGVLGVAVTLAGAGLLAASIFLPSQPRCSALLVAGAISSLMLAGLDRLRHRMDALALRAMADLALLTPLFLLISAGRR